MYDGREQEGLDENGRPLRRVGSDPHMFTPPPASFSRCSLIARYESTSENIRILHRHLAALV